MDLPLQNGVAQGCRRPSGHPSRAAAQLDTVPERRAPTISCAVVEPIFAVKLKNIRVVNLKK